MDETYIGGVSPGARGRGTKKAVVAIAVERLGFGKKSKRVKLGRVRMRVIPNTQRQTLEDFITDVIEPGSVVHTDAKQEYNRIDQLGYTHQVTNQSSSNGPAHVSMPGVHRVASLVKRWVLGTHQGGLARQHLDAYLDEFVFRFNRRASRNRALVFYRLLEQCLRTKPLSGSDIVMSRRGQRGARRGPAQKPNGERHGNLDQAAARSVAVAASQTNSLAARRLVSRTTEAPGCLCSSISARMCGLRVRRNDQMKRMNCQLIRS